MPIQDRNYYREDGSYREPRGPRTMVVTLIIINTVIFAIDAFTVEVAGGNWLSWMMSLKTDGQGTLAENGTPFWQLPFWNIWQIFTYGFAHASISSSTGIWHLLANMIGLFFLGRSVESRYGSSEFLKIYLLSLFFSGALSLFYNFGVGASVHLVGASGAVTAIVILFVLDNPKATLMIWGVIPAPAWLIGSMLVGYDLLRAFRPETTQVGWYAHLAGALFAFLYFKLNWNFQWIKLDWLSDRLSGKPQLRVHREKDPDEDLKTRADEILEKIHREGESSLTRKERKTLEKYSRNVRKTRD